MAIASPAERLRTCLTKNPSFLFVDSEQYESITAAAGKAAFAGWTVCIALDQQRLVTFVRPGHLLVVSPALAANVCPHAVTRIEASGELPRSLFSNPRIPEKGQVGRDL